MEIDFDSQNHLSDYVTVPAGTYVCRIAEVRPGSTRAGDERWSLRLVVAHGQHVGKQAAWDSLVFSTRGRARVRMVFQALGLPATGKVEVKPQDLEGRTALVEVRPAEYTSPGGQVVRRNEVPYDGYRGDGGGEGVGGGRAESPGPAGGAAGSGGRDLTEEIPF